MSYFSLYIILCSVLLLLNSTNIDACITRLRLNVHDSDLVDEQAAKALGAMAVIKLGKTGVQIVVGQQAEKIADKMKKLV